MLTRGGMQGGRGPDLIVRGPLRSLRLLRSFRSISRRAITIRAAPTHRRIPMRHCFLTALILWSLALTPRLPAQTPLPNYPVRVTVRDISGERRLIGRLTAVTPDSLTLRVANAASTLAVDRRTVTRVERQRSASIGKPAGLACLVLGGTLALLGSQVHETDSPGSKTRFVLGCGLGALGGAVISRMRRQWEEIIL